MFSFPSDAAPRDSHVSTSCRTIELRQFLGFVVKMIHFALHDRLSFEIHYSCALGDARIRLSTPVWSPEMLCIC